MSNLGRRGEVWFAEIKGKRRPVLIVSHHDVVVELDRVIANITSQQPRNKYDVVLEYWKEAGFRPLLGAQKLTPFIIGSFFSKLETCTNMT
ncbi:hypothetical protein HNQ34_003416 [Anoxybacillus tepidamans]|uniref:Type II toxin-antitoxin system PemK/MazF family toxin n=2 Tax=Anoxybacillaceae TaxID=3120669 RepID=A0A1I0TQ35_9BACL|nr:MULTISPECIES: hypothetical protein [Anoxybacillus]MBB5326282.1 hypothetical protein [Anoxybacillus tepidamans]SFA53867.1 hypothetical protein SAMN05216169_10389 [Anoxybacillus pushchinoensis]